MYSKLSIFKLQNNILNSNKVERLDAVEFLSKLPEESVDCIFTDPAYESLEKHRTSNSRLVRWFDIFPNSRFLELATEMYRVLKSARHCYIMADQETMFIIKPIFESVGFRFWKPIIWDKIHIGMGYHYRCQYECILFFEKGKRSLNDLGVSDVRPYKRVHGKYPTEKPVELIEEIICNSTMKREIVIDPFCGSGAVAEATIRNNRIFFGSDISSDAVKLTANRILRSRGLKCET